MVEINALGTKAHSKVFGFLNEAVFGVKEEKATEEQKRQREFSMRQLKEIMAQAAEEEGEEG